MGTCEAADPVVSDQRWHVSSGQRSAAAGHRRGSTTPVIRELPRWMATAKMFCTSRPVTLCNLNLDMRRMVP